MPYVMQPWTGLSQSGSQPKLAQEEEEGFIHGGGAEGLTSERNKHPCFRTCHLLATLKVERQLPCRRRMKWHEPTFAKFRLADVKSVRTDIIDLECKRLGDPQPAGRH